MNKVQIIGRCTKDPDVRYASASQTAIARLTVAVDDGYGEKKKTNFIPVVAFGKTAEACEKFTAKGLRVAVEGKINTGSYDDKDGKKVYTTDVIADRVEFIDWANQQNQQPQDDTPFMEFATVDGPVPF